MPKEPENMNIEQSLDTIANMLTQARGNIRENSFYFLLWGWAILFCEVGMFVLIRLDYPYAQFIWLLTIPVWLISMYYGSKQSKRMGAVSYFARVHMWLWIGFGIAILPIIFFGYKINFNITQIILLFTSLPTLVSGILLRFKPLIFGGVMFWIFGIISFLVGFEFSSLVAAVAIAIGYLIPGYMLKAKKE